MKDWFPRFLIILSELAIKVHIFHLNHWKVIKILLIYWGLLLMRSISSPQAMIRLLSHRLFLMFRENLHLKGHTACIRDLKVASESKYIVSSGWDRTVLVWSIHKKEKIAGTESIESIAVSTTNIRFIVNWKFFTIKSHWYSLQSHSNIRFEINNLCRHRLHHLNLEYFAKISKASPFGPLMHIILASYRWWWVPNISRWWYHHIFLGFISTKYKIYLLGYDSYISLIIFSHA